MAWHGVPLFGASRRRTEPPRSSVYVRMLSGGGSSSIRHARIVSCLPRVMPAGCARGGGATARAHAPQPALYHCRTCRRSSHIDVMGRRPATRFPAEERPCQAAEQDRPRCCWVRPKTQPYACLTQSPSPMRVSPRAPAQPKIVLDQSSPARLVC
jgi:hypothetical protein